MASLPKKQPQNHGCPTPSPQVKIIEHEHEHEHEHHKHALRSSMIVMACMFGVVMLLCTVSVLIKYLYSRRYGRHPNRRDTPILFDVNGDSLTSDNDDDVAIVHPIWNIRTVGLQQSLIDSIAVFEYKKDDGVIDGTECSVCLGEFEHGESLRLLPKCSHAFHIPCIDTWLRSHKNCPLCRAPVLHNEIRDVHQNNNHTDENVSDLQIQDQEAQVQSIEDGDGSGVSSAAEVETRPLRRSSSASMVFGDVVVDLETEFGEKVISSRKDTTTSVAKKRPISMRRSFSHNRKFLFSRHCRSQSSTLPL